MIKHLELVRSEQHISRGKTYQLNVYRVVETGEHRVHISNPAMGVEVLATADGDTVADGAATGIDIDELLIQVAKGDIDANAWGKY